MGMSALLNEAAALVAIFRDKNKVIDTAVANAVKAVPVMSKTFYVDAVLGDDAIGAGDKATPFKTLAKAVSTIPYGGGGIIYLADAQEFLMSANISLSRKSITIAGAPGYVVKPTVRNICLAVTNETTGFLMDSSTLVLRSLRLRTADWTVTDGIGSNIYEGLIRRNDRPFGNLHTDQCYIEVGDTPLMRLTTNGQLPIVSFYSNKISRVGPKSSNTPLVVSAGAPMMFSVSGNIVPVGTKWVDDLLVGTFRDANGLPRNIIANTVL